MIVFDKWKIDQFIHDHKYNYIIVTLSTNSNNINLIADCTTWCGTTYSTTVKYYDEIVEYIQNNLRGSNIGNTYRKIERIKRDK
jgi:hypothetical protein